MIKTKRIKVGIISYYDYEKYICPNNELKIYENWNKAWEEVFHLCERNNISLYKYNAKYHEKYEKIIFIEIPRINSLIKVFISNLFKKRISTILIINETFLGRPRYILKIPFLFNKVLVNCEENLKRYQSYKIKTFSYPSLPSKKVIKSLKESILNPKRSNKLVYVSSFKMALSRHGSYKFRYKLIKSLLKYKTFFNLYGYGWDRVPLPFDIIGIAIIVRIPLIKYFVRRIMALFFKPLGQFPIAKSKEKKLQSYDFALAIEPTISKFNSICEKIFDPMISGSIPIYYGQKLTKDIPSNSYININKQISPNELVNKLKKISPKKKDAYRKNIYNFLNSDKANKYRYSSYAKLIVDSILS